MASYFCEFSGPGVCATHPVLYWQLLPQLVWRLDHMARPGARESCWHVADIVPSVKKFSMTQFHKCDWVFWDFAKTKWAWVYCRRYSQTYDSIPIASCDSASNKSGKRTFHLPYTLTFNLRISSMVSFGDASNPTPNGGFKFRKSLGSRRWGVYKFVMATWSKGQDERRGYVLCSLSLCSSRCW